MPKRKTKPARKEVSTENIDPDQSICADSSNEAALKKEAFMRDFDIQVNERLKALDRNKKTALKEINRMFLSEKMKLKKEVRQMTVKEFAEQGGDFKCFDFTVVAAAVVGDVSFMGDGDNMQDTVVKAPPPKASTAARTVRKRNTVMAESPLIHDAPLTRSTRSARSRKVVNAASSLVTPSITRNNRGGYGLPSKTPLITPKFDPRQPLTAAREPKAGETLVSLSGSPVIQNTTAADDTRGNLLSLRLDKHQTLLGGFLFDETMSPGTLNTNKERLQEAIGAIESRLGELTTQFSGQSASGLQITKDSNSS